MYANLGAAPDNEWIRLADFAPLQSGGTSSVMNDYGASFHLLDPGSWDDHSFVDFSGSGWNFYIRNGEDFTIRAHGYDKDCFDDHFGYHHIDRLAPQLTCKSVFAPSETGQNDAVDSLEADYLAPTYGVDPNTGHADRVIETELHRFTYPFDPHPQVDVPQYEITTALDVLPLGDEDRADLQITKSCLPSGGTSFTCTITARNAGPGLPRDAVVTDQLTTGAPAGSFTLSTPTFTVDGDATTMGSCNVTSPTAFSCAIGTVPVGGRVDIAFDVSPSAPGSFDDMAMVSAASADPAPTNNSATASLTVVQVDVQPPSPTAVVINLAKSGVVPVAILTTPRFDARTVSFSSVCFGSPSNATARTCTEVHGAGHVLDVDRDRDLDMLLHYEVRRTGLQANDTQACLSGLTMSGRTIIGCDAIIAR
jgi:hypothetical protein